MLQEEDPYPRRMQEQASCIQTLKTHQLLEVKGEGLTVIVATVTPTITDLLGKQSLP